ncbi:MAG: glycosyltransferase family 39 protein, partial [Candidatus Eisenbacteria bacterium]|nr:glycosyltransferase family 39 protein [Candidatus Eisenbacteria bacterium]
MSRAPRPTPVARAVRGPAFTLHAGAPDALPQWLTWAGWAIVAGYALAALFMALGPHTVGDVFTETDFYGSYGPGARALLQGHLDPSHYGVVGPMFEFMLAALGLVIHDLFTAAELLAVISMTATLAFWHSLLTRRANAGVAFVALLFMAGNAQFFRFGWSATTDAPALALQSAALWTLFGARDGAASLRRVGVAGLIAGLAFLTRYNSIALLLAGAMAVALGWDGSERGTRARRALVFAAGFVAPVAPWMAWSASHGGAVRFQLHHNIAYEVFAKPHGIVWDLYERDLEPQFPTPWSVLARDPVAVVSRMFFNLFDHFKLDAFGGDKRTALTGAPFALAAMAGAWLAFKDGLLPRLRSILLAMLWLFLTLVPAQHSERYSLAVLPAWALFAGALFASPRFAAAFNGVWLKALLIPVVLAPGLMVTRAFSERVINQLPVEVLSAAEQIKPLVKPGEKVLARKPHFAWYAGLTPLTLPLADTLSQWGDAARQTGARWLYFSWPEAQMRPRFEWLLDSTSTAPGLTVRAATEHWPAVVYEIGPAFGQEPAWIGNDTLEAVHRARARV